MKKLYAPWRSKYTNHNSTSDKANTDMPCVFCQHVASTDDQKNFIIKRFKHCFVMLNLHPYNAGHCMVLPYKHSESLDLLTSEIRAEIMEVTSQAITVIRQVLKSDAVNMGINLGKAAGGSIPDHLHIHILPRWWGDTNFLATLADTKSIVLDLHEVYRSLCAAFGS